MSRLIVHLKAPLNASFCVDLVVAFGNCRVTPLIENCCIVEGYKMEYTKNGFLHLLEFIQIYANKAFLTLTYEDLDIQVQWLKIFPEKGLICSFEPPEIITITKIQLNNQLWCLIPWKQIKNDDFDAN